MATTPEGITLATNTEVVSYPTETWRFDRAAGRLTDRFDRLEAVTQAVEVILNVRRFHWQIYTPNFGSIFDDLPGLDFAFCCSEIERRAKDALSVDSRILSVEQFAFRQEGDRLTADFTVKTVYGSFEMGVTI